MVVTTIGEVCTECHFYDIEQSGSFIPQVNELVN